MGECLLTAYMRPPLSWLYYMSLIFQKLNLFLFHHCQIRPIQTGHVFVFTTEVCVISSLSLMLTTLISTGKERCGEKFREEFQQQVSSILLLLLKKKRSRLLDVIWEPANAPKYMWVYYTHRLTPTCFNHSHGHLQGGALLRIEILSEL